MTNHFDLQAAQIAELYKSRWQVELFFKWIKQNLRIKAFVGTSMNAAKITAKVIQKEITPLSKAQLGIANERFQLAA